MVIMQVLLKCNWVSEPCICVKFDITLSLGKIVPSTPLIPIKESFAQYSIYIVIAKQYCYEAQYIQSAW